ncbi:MAG TPA: ligase-associated DNA damage response endonuclease PdeM [Pirellulales bacterium]|nr:ligase-associated DNA damage response endonuclease PdeM [Pirellulales bacterium]
MTEPIELEQLGEPLLLLPEKAIYRPRLRTLFVADTHFGKAATFRQSGIPIPQGTTTTGLARLSAVVERTKAERLVILGDFFHAAAGRAPATLAAIGEWFRSNRQLTVVLVRGNHDRHAGDPPNDWRLDCRDQLVEPPFVYLHEPAEHPAGFALAGHIHPGIALFEGFGPPVRSACFWFSKHWAVLPAFGSFTGSVRIDPAADDRVFAVGENRVIEVPHRPSPRLKRDAR